MCRLVLYGALGLLGVLLVDVIMLQQVLCELTPASCQARSTAAVARFVAQFPTTPC